MLSSLGCGRLPPKVRFFSIIASPIARPGERSNGRSAGETLEGTLEMSAPDRMEADALCQRNPKQTSTYLSTPASGHAYG